MLYLQIAVKTACLLPIFYVCISIAHANIRFSLPAYPSPMILSSNKSHFPGLR